MAYAPGGAKGLSNLNKVVKAGCDYIYNKKKHVEAYLVAIC